MTQALHEEAVQRSRPNPRVLIIDEHEMFSAAITLALRVHGFDAHPLATVSGTPQIAAQAHGLAPGVVLLDAHLGRDTSEQGRQTVELLRALHRQGSVVVVLADRYSRQARCAALVAAGAVDVVDKSAPLPTLIDTITAAAVGAPIMSGRVRNQWLAVHRGIEARCRDLRAQVERLSRREREVLDLLAQGHRAPR